MGHESAPAEVSQEKEKKKVFVEFNVREKFEQADDDQIVTVVFDGMNILKLTEVLDAKGEDMRSQLQAGYDTEHGGVPEKGNIHIWFATKKEFQERFNATYMPGEERGQS